jgi:predicted amino acid-binding ACT domain protein
MNFTIALENCHINIFNVSEFSSNLAIILLVDCENKSLKYASFNQQLQEMRQCLAF